MLPGLDLYCTELAHHLITAGWYPDDLTVDDISVDHLSVDDLSDVWYPLDA